MDFEDKLEKVHASLGGQGGKKFGFENMQRNGDNNNDEQQQEFFAEKQDRDMDKMNRHASSFLKSEAALLPPKPEKQVQPKVVGRLPHKASG